MTRVRRAQAALRRDGEKITRFRTSPPITTMIMNAVPAAMIARYTASARSWPREERIGVQQRTQHGRRGDREREHGDIAGKELSARHSPGIGVQEAPHDRPEQEREDQEHEMHERRISAGAADSLIDIKSGAVTLHCNARMGEAEILEALRTVQDPEAGMSIVDLGLVYGVAAEPGRVHVRMTVTSPACPAAPYLVDEATAAVRALAPEGTEVEVELVWEPPWTPERMSAEAQKRFGWTG
jgi:metal-sulfur cluster biosynthetic enzyme